MMEVKLKLKEMNTQTRLQKLTSLGANKQFRDAFEFDMNIFGKLVMEHLMENGDKKKIVGIVNKIEDDKNIRFTNNFYKDLIINRRTYPATFAALIHKLIIPRINDLENVLRDAVQEDTPHLYADDIPLYWLTQIWNIEMYNTYYNNEAHVLYMEWVRVYLDPTYRMDYHDYVDLGYIKQWLKRFIWSNVNLTISIRNALYDNHDKLIPTVEVTSEKINFLREVLFTDITPSKLRNFIHYYFEHFIRWREPKGGKLEGVRNIIEEIFEGNEKANKQFLKAKMEYELGGKQNEWT